MPTVGPILITGATGMLGSALSALCPEIGESFYPYAESELDITDRSAVDACISEFSSLGGCVVVNAAAYTDVERAESDIDRAYSVNDRGAANVAEAASNHGMTLVHVSTDFVFDGTKPSPYDETDAPNPLNVYGRSKLAGERSVLSVCPDVLLVRTAWVYGPNGNNFPRKILELVRTHGQIEVVVNEIGSPTASADLARGIVGLCTVGARGIFHLAGSGSCSRFEMAEEIVKASNLRVRLVPVESSKFPSKAIRPSSSALSSEKARRLGVELPPWQSSLRSYVEQVCSAMTSNLNY